MKTKDLKAYLSGGDLRSIGSVNELLPLIKTQKDFDELFVYLFSEDRLIVMRAADAVEKVTLIKPDYLQKHKSNILKLLKTSKDKELKWHLALLTSRIKYAPKELKEVFKILIRWAEEKTESKIVRVNSLQSLYDLSRENKELRKDFKTLIDKISKENIPSINARLKKFKD